jgi:ABC-2 type transport system ATP-binding protein
MGGRLTADPLVAENLGRRYGDQWALRGASFRLAKGTVTGLVGNNGAGKSTLLKMVCGLLEPTEGTLRVAGGDPLAPKTRAAIGYVPEDSPLYEEQTPLECLAFFARLYGLPAKPTAEKAKGLLRRMRLDEPYWTKPIGQLSKGSVRKVALARALLHDPPVLVLDEPASGLDPATRRELDAVLAALRGEGTCILLSGHHLRQVEELCDRILLLDHGRIVAAGTLAELRSAWGGTRYRLRATAAFPGAHLDGTLHVAQLPDWAAAQRAVAAVQASGGRVVELESTPPELEEILRRAAGA